MALPSADMKKLIVFLTPLLIFGFVLHAEYRVKSAINDYAKASLVEVDHHDINPTQQKALDTLYLYHEWAFYSTGEIEVMLEISLLKRLALELCILEKPDDMFATAQCKYAKLAIEDAEDSRSLELGYRSYALLIWQELKENIIAYWND